MQCKYAHQAMLFAVRFESRRQDRGELIAKLGPGVCLAPMDLAARLRGASAVVVIEVHWNLFQLDILGWRMKARRLCMASSSRWFWSSRYVIGRVPVPIWQKPYTSANFPASFALKGLINASR